MPGMLADPTMCHAAMKTKLLTYVAMCIGDEACKCTRCSSIFRSVAVPLSTIVPYH
ncbi:hypothetical protein SCLCIDRAFT_1215218 [Scleroderma citrinum Foug A]|uniref:Uncharacterized protein n=1 Tax=Scleroderma citrinum Foug A TaxID=1036808 RepID=A0A0C2ZL76_9AGAM|nr:hypothetical protein SCLCIDRAFT_1215218 [Scleroderma citrinum Foug A]